MLAVRSSPARLSPCSAPSPHTAQLYQFLGLSLDPFLILLCLGNPQAQL